MHRALPEYQEEMKSGWGDLSLNIRKGIISVIYVLTGAEAHTEQLGRQNFLHRFPGDIAPDSLALQFNCNCNVKQPTQVLFNQRSAYP